MGVITQGIQKMPGTGTKVDHSKRTRVFETRTATGREIFACQDRIVSQIFILLISNEERYLAMWMWLCEGKLK